jgi:colicin import membrane protein
MSLASDRPEFMPPQPPGRLRAIGLALLAHVVLIAALTWGVSWKRESNTSPVQAELWSAVPQEAAPALVEPTVTPPPEPKPVPPAPVPEPQPKPPQPVPAKVVAPPPEPVIDPQIALEKEKKKKIEKAKALADAKAKAKAKAEAEAEAEEARQEALDKKKRLEAKKTEAKKLEAKKAADAKAREAQEAKENAQIAAIRAANMKRMAGLAGATGAESATGTAKQSSGPSPGYGGRVSARIKPNIVFADDVTGNPTATVEVRTSPDGTIIGRKLTKSSGIKAWDDAVLRAIDKTETLPRDTDGRVPSSLEINFRPKD